MLRLRFLHHGGEVEAFVGLDVCMKETAVCVMDDTGQRAWEGSVQVRLIELSIGSQN